MVGGGGGGGGVGGGGGGEGGGWTDLPSLVEKNPRGNTAF